MCPNTTLGESVTCAVNDILTNSNSVCTLSVETMVCGFQSHVSEAVTAMLKGIIIIYITQSSFSITLIA